MPGVFERLAGQEDAVAELTAAALAARARVPGQGWEGSDPRMVHAWLFTGPPGSGRSVAATCFAAALQCEHPEIVGCGECRACHTVLAGTHADVHHLAPQGVNILLKDVKETIHRAASRPGTGRWQIVVVEEADRLTEQSGNALLKVVEEPPSRTVFLLCSPTTDPMDIMVTLRSRSRNVALRQPGAAAVERVLLAEGQVEPERARWAASVSSGHVGRARWL
ncbi:MAG TPA: DNA polymerase III subunit delta', partial [Actinomycetales bacterium]|nr:DNA polymerase III subunit delta' [Actinomycetales bacterium]